MRFSHTADCHIGGHRDPRLRKLTEQAFEKFISTTIEEGVDFALIAGDLFNTAIPGIDTLKHTVVQLNRLKEQNIPAYIIPGSHDYSPSGKTMLDVLESAELVTNVWRSELQDEILKLSPTIDKKTGAQLTGILGKRKMLDHEHYNTLDHSSTSEKSAQSDSAEFRIFLFHTAILELTENPMMKAQPLSSLPKGFDYYAGGHVHIVKRFSAEEYPEVVYPGPLFPNSFSELEELGQGGFFIYDSEKKTLERKDIVLKNTIPITVDVSGKSASEAKALLREQFNTSNVSDAIVLVRVQGTLSSGEISDLDLRGAIGTLEEQGAYCVLRNTANLSVESFEGKQVQDKEPRDLELQIIEKHKDQLTIGNLDGRTLAQQLLHTLAEEQKEGEKQYEYRERIVTNALQALSKAPKVAERQST